MATDNGWSVGEAVSFEQIEKKVSPHGEVSEIPRTVLGYKIFRWLLGIVATMMLLIVIFAAATYPPSSVSDTGLQSDEAMRLIATQRAEWRDGIERIGQVYLIGPVLPLIGTVLGYMFGRHETTGERS